MTWVKFCGCTSRHDVEAAIEAGADAVGLIFAPSPRRVAWEAAAEIARALPAGIEAVAVFVDPSQRELDEVASILPRASLQFSGSEESAVVNRYGERAIKAIHVRAGAEVEELAAEAAAFARARVLFDTHRDGYAGGTGVAFAWERVARIARERPVIVAGGLNPENVARCLETVRPYGVDVRGGIESGGAKNAAKMRAFVRAVRSADAA